MRATKQSVASERHSFSCVRHTRARVPLPPQRQTRRPPCRPMTVASKRGTRRSRTECTCGHNRSSRRSGEQQGLITVEMLGGLACGRALLCGTGPDALDACAAVALLRSRRRRSTGLESFSARGGHPHINPGRLPTAALGSGRVLSTDSAHSTDSLPSPPSPPPPPSPPSPRARRNVVVVGAVVGGVGAICALQQRAAG